MTQRLKRWESPRREGRNHKGKGGSARQRQLKKQQQVLRNKLKESGNSEKPNQNHNHQNPDGKRSLILFPFCLGVVTHSNNDVRSHLQL